MQFQVEQIEFVQGTGSNTTEDVLEALVHFREESDASTAQLLSDSLLIDRQAPTHHLRSAVKALPGRDLAGARTMESNE